METYKYKKYLSKINGGVVLDLRCDNVNKTIDILDILSVKSNKFNRTLNVFEEIIINFRDGQNKKFIFIEEISRGGFGYVTLYASSDEDIAVKYGIENSDLDQDIKIIKKLKMNNICNKKYIGSYICEKKHEKKHVIMPYMDSTLECYIRANLLTNDEVFQIMIELFNMVICLYEDELYYTDLKTQNVLVKCIENNKVDLLLGDIGGIFEKDSFSSENFSFTFPCVFKMINSHKFYFNKINTLSLCDVLFPLGVIFLNLKKNKNRNLIGLIDNFSHSGILHNNEQIRVMLQEEINNYPNLFALNDEIIRILLFERYKKIIMDSINEFIKDIANDEKKNIVKNIMISLMYMNDESRKIYDKKKIENLKTQFNILKGDKFAQKKDMKQHEKIYNYYWTDNKGTQNLLLLENKTQELSLYCAHINLQKLTLFIHGKKYNFEFFEEKNGNIYGTIQIDGKTYNLYTDYTKFDNVPNYNLCNK
jgi:hypothetical protein